MSDADRYLGLARGTARRWIDGYRRGSVNYPPVIREETTGSDAASWGELLETSLLAGFRSSGATLQRLRPAVQRLRDELATPYPLVARRALLDVAGRELVMRIQDDTDLEPGLRLVVVRSNQLVLTRPAEAFTKRATFDGEIVTDLGMDERHTVTLSPIRAMGRPAVRSVPAEVLAEGFRAGESVADLARLYDLGYGEVEAALRFELQVANHDAA